MQWLGDRAHNSTIDFKFTTIDSTGAGATLSGTPTIALYDQNSTTESATGVTLTVDFDGRTGSNHVRIVGSTAGLVNGHDYQVVITAGTVSGVSVVGSCVGQFAVRNTSRNEAIYYGTVTGSASTTGFADSALPSRDDNHWQGRVVVFLTGNLTLQARDIQTYTNSTKAFVTSAWTQAPTVGDAYGIY